MEIRTPRPSLPIWSQMTSPTELRSEGWAFESLRRQLQTRARWTRQVNPTPPLARPPLPSNPLAAPHARTRETRVLCSGALGRRYGRSQRMPARLTSPFPAQRPRLPQSAQPH